MGTIPLRSLGQNRRMLKPHRLLALALALISALATMSLLGGCGTTAKQLGERAFVEAVNLKCRSDKQKFALAKRVAKELGDTPKGQELQSDAQERLDELSGRWSDLRKSVDSLNGPKPVRDALNNASDALKSLSSKVADKSLSPQEAKDQLESARAELRAKGFVDCV
jgi:hypothetical protein